MNFAKFLRTPFFIEHIWWLLLYSNFDHKKVVDNKSFEKYRKPHFSDKSLTFNKITLVVKDLIIDQNKEIAKTFNDFFTKVVSILNITQYEDPSVIQFYE